MRIPSALTAIANRVLAFAVAFAVAFSLVPTAPHAAFADDSGDGEKVVRVGWLANNEGFQEGEPGGYLTGWGYEYLQTLSYYTPGWKYEYVTGTFSELMQKLEAGEIDLMPNISYTEARAEKLLFSTNPQGTERYYIYAKSSRDDLTKGDPSALNGLVIGCNKGVIQTKAGQEWLADEGVSCAYKYYDTGDELFSALSADEVDAIIMNDTISSDDAMAMFSVGESNYYLVTPKTRPDLMDDINAAMTMIQSANPRYNDEVKTNYSVSNGGSTTLTSAERSWLDGRGWAIAVGYLDSAHPYSSETSDGAFDGSLSALTDALENRFGITVNMRAYSSNADMKAALLDGDIDVAMPVAKDYWLAEQDDCIQSSAMAQTALIAVYTGGRLEDALSSIAYSPESLLNRSLVGVRFPQASIVDCPSAVESIEAVKRGEAACAIIPVTGMDVLRERIDFSGLKTAQLTDGIDLACWMKRGNAELLSIVDKAIVESKDEITAGAYHFSTQDSDTGLVKFVKDNQMLVAACALVFLVVVVAVLTWALRKARRAQKKAQAANAAKTAFLSRMSHDIRTPLNGIVGLIEVNDLNPGNVELASENRAKAKVAANHLLTIINDILEMSKIEDRAIVLENKPFNLVELFREIRILSQLRASDRGVSLSVCPAETLEYPDVYGSPTHVRRVMVNLLDNSIKYNKPGGSVSCSCSVVRVEGDTVVYRFIITDTGIGMSEDFLEHIFEPFSQAADDARSTFQGTGMGMPIVKGLVDEMGGTIDVQSELGQGSTFAVVLPFAIDRDPAAHKREREEGSDCSIANMNIMLAEDNDLNAEIAETLLENEGATVVRVRDGKEAVDMFCRKQPGTFDAILMDIMMPRMNGYEAARAIRLSDRLDAASIPIVAMTANAFAEDVKAVQDEGMNGHLSKPVDVDLLKRTLASCRDR